MFYFWQPNEVRDKISVKSQQKQSFKHVATLTNQRKKQNFAGSCLLFMEKCSKIIFKQPRFLVPTRPCLLNSTAPYPKENLS